METILPSPIYVWAETEKVRKPKNRIVTTEKKKIIFTGNKLPLTEPMLYDMPAVNAIENKNTNTFDEIISGNRISTTRGYWYNVVRGIVARPEDMIGKVLTFRSKDNKVIDVIVDDVHRITNEDRVNPEFLEQWEKSERWKREHLLRETKVGEYQVKYHLASAEKQLSLLDKANHVSDEEVEQR